MKKNKSRFANVKYTLCKKCDHFVAKNDIGNGEFYVDDPKKPATEVGLARYIHLDDGDQEYDHDASPGETHLMKVWKALQPDFFTEYTDGKIGPNSIYHSRRGKMDPPKRCPFCGGPNIIDMDILWDTASREDSDNVSALTEYQCRTCSNRSFWA